MSQTTRPERTPYARHQGHAQRLSRFVFTLNNYTEIEYEDLKKMPVQWMILGKEKGESGTEHIQGAVLIGKQIAFTTIKKWNGLQRAHIEPMKGTPQQSLAYCSKEDQHPFILGNLPAPGREQSDGLYFRTTNTINL